MLMKTIKIGDQYSRLGCFSTRTKHKIFFRQQLTFLLWWQS